MSWSGTFKKISDNAYFESINFNNFKKKKKWKPPTPKRKHKNNSTKFKVCENCLIEVLPKNYNEHGPNCEWRLENICFGCHYPAEKCDCKGWS